MLKNKKITKISLIIAAVLMVGVISFFAINGTVSADELTPQDPEEVLPSDTLDSGPVGRGGRGMRYGGEVFLQSIADQSGIALADLQAAVDNHERIEDVLSEAGFSADEIDTMFYTAQVAVIDQGVVDGKLTEEQAVTLKAQLDERIERRAAQEATRSAMQDSWLQILSEKLGLSVEELQTTLDETRSEVIDQALADGLITEEQAQAMREHDGSSFGFGGRHFHGSDDVTPETEDSSNNGTGYGGGNF